MTSKIEILTEAQKLAMKVRPKVGGFPVLAEVLRRAGIEKNVWYLPSCQSVYLLGEEAVVQQGTPLVTGTHPIPKFDEAFLIKALRADQAGLTTFSEFLEATWKAGVVSYVVDFVARQVAYFGVNGEKYVESYPLVEVKL